MFDDAGSSYSALQRQAPSDVPLPNAALEPRGIREPLRLFLEDDVEEIIQVEVLPQDPAEHPRLANRGILPEDDAGMMFPEIERHQERELRIVVGRADVR
jgi:hypothetical protein